MATDIVTAVSYTHLDVYKRQTWMMLPIRANANTPINENKPSDAAEVLAYYNREQYGINPLFYGPQYTCLLYTSRCV